MQKIPIRRDSLDQLQEELKQLKTVERPQIIKAISEAREPVSYTHLTLPTTPYV